MVDVKPGDLLDFGEGKLEAVRAVFFDPCPQSIVLTHKITVPTAYSV